jgi:hypothetical protein
MIRAFDGNPRLPDRLPDSYVTRRFFFESLPGLPPRIRLPGIPVWRAGAPLGDVVARDHVSASMSALTISFQSRLRG